LLEEMIDEPMEKLKV